MRRLIAGFALLGLLATPSAWGTEANASVSVSVRVVPVMGVSATSHVLGNLNGTTEIAQARRIIAVTGTARLENPTLSTSTDAQTVGPRQPAMSGAKSANVRQLELTVVDL